MKILSLECSANPASAAVVENGKVIASSFVNVKLTHSQTLMPMVKNILSASKTDFDEIDGIAVGAGPGSFTGVRIGISMAKGLATPKDLPCVAVSTLVGLAQNFVDREGCIICPCMDARCKQLYNALFEIKNGEIIRLCEDRALMCEDLAEELKKYNKSVIICGDGADLFYDYVEEFDNIFLATENLKFQNAVSVALYAEKMFISGETVSSETLLPVYLRLPQAERELKEKGLNK